MGICDIWMSRVMHVCFLRIKWIKVVGITSRSLWFCSTVCMRKVWDKKNVKIDFGGMEIRKSQLFP